MEEITMNSQATKKDKAIKRDIDNIIERIGDVRNYLMLVHAFGGQPQRCPLI